MRVLVASVIALAAVPPAKAAAPLLQPCSIGPTSARCGTVVVPENRLAADSRTIGLHVAVLPATGKPVRRDPLVYVVGGPGGVATDAVPYVATALSSINVNRDIVFVDQRGVGGSNPLTCAPAPPSYTGTVATYIDACIKGTGADVTHYRTPDAIDDLESVRIALGYPKVNVYGGSYGGTVVQMYLAQHPEGVRTAIMDSTSWFDVPVFERWGSSAQRALDLIHQRCLKEVECHATFPRWYERFRPLLWKLAHGGAVAETGFTIDAQVTADVVEDMTTTAQGASEVPFTLAKAEAGNFTPLARQIELRSSGGGSGPLGLMWFAITCTEPWAAMDPARVWNDVRSTYMRYASWTPSMVEQAQACAAWPKVKPDPQELARVHSTLPVLNLVGAADPKDPAPNTAGFARQMPNGKEIVVPEQGHGAAFAGCMPRVLAEFLDAGTVKGLDTSCVSLIQAPAFRLK